MDQRLMALQQAMGSMGGGEMPPGAMPEEQLPPEPQAPAMDEGAAVEQAVSLLAPFAESNELIREALTLLEGGLGGPEGDVPPDTESEEEMPEGA